MNVSLSQVPLFQALESSERILLAGAGGGFDIYSGIPLYLALSEMGKEVTLANLSFSLLVQGEKLTDVCFRIDADTPGNQYFPEKWLCEWLRSKDIETSVYAFSQTGVQPLHHAYQHLVDQHQIDTVILIDGGTDSLMRGNEAGLGTPAEDAISLLAVSLLEIPQSFLVCLGFGVDHFHGVSHAQVLENIAKLDEIGAFLGAFSVLGNMKEGKALIDLVAHSNKRMPQHSSIVANSVASALEAQFGNIHATNRTRGSELFINPLMSLYWSFYLPPAANSILYQSMIMHSRTFHEVQSAIRLFRQTIPAKPWKDIPL